MHDHIDRAGILIDEEDALPGRASVRRAIDAALLLGTIAMPLRRNEHDVRVGRVDDDAPGAACGVRPRVGPRSSCVGRLVQTVADGDVTPDPRLTRSGPHDARIGW